MRVGVDVHIAAKPNRRGVPHYVEQVVARLLEGWPTEQWRLLHVGSADAAWLPAPFRDHRELLVTGSSRATTLLRLRLAGRGHDQLLGDLDVMFVPGIGPTQTSRQTPLVLTVHDMLHVTNRRQLGARHRLWLRLIRPQAQLTGARLLLANSEHTKRELLEHADVDEEKIRVIPHGVDDHYFDDGHGEVAAVLGRHGLSPGYVLHLGTLEARKNIPALIAAVKTLRRARPETELVLAGAPGAGIEVDGDTADGVRFLGMIPDEEKRALYTAAGAYCSVSHAEGLGLTPLEALACGTPSVVSSIPAFKESLGPDAALFVEDRRNPLAIATALERVLDDRQVRAEVRARSRPVLARYRWDACARSTYQAIMDAATSTDG